MLKVVRVHHATSEHDFGADETEFLMAMDAFKRESGKQFPTLCDTLGVVLSLGYTKRPRAMSVDDALVA